MTDLEKEYASIMNSQQFDSSELDYSILERHKLFLTQLAKVSNSGITVFDMYQQKHVFTSYNFADLFGYDLDAIDVIGSEYFDERIHPEDFEILAHNAAHLFKIFLNNKKIFSECKLINEYRIRSVKGEYVRVIEQHQALEFDKSGNVWLSLSVLDLSPDQRPFQGVKCKVFNHKTGEHFSAEDLFLPKTQINLTSREVQILQLIKDGLLSKEISEQLYISVHTVNTHRQKILEKLQADNSMEAVKYASKLGLLS